MKQFLLLNLFIVLASNCYSKSDYKDSPGHYIMAEGGTFPGISLIYEMPLRSGFSLGAGGLFCRYGPYYSELGYKVTGTFSRPTFVFDLRHSNTIGRSDFFEFVQAGMTFFQGSYNFGPASSYFYKSSNALMLSFGVGYLRYIKGTRFSPFVTLRINTMSYAVTNTEPAVYLPANFYYFEFYPVTTIGVRF